MLIYRKSPLVAFFVKAITVLAVFFGPLSAIRLQLEEHSYRKHGLTALSEPVSWVASASSVNNNQRAGLLTGEIAFTADDGLRYTVTRAISEEDKWRSADPDGRVRMEYLAANPRESARLSGHHLNPAGALILAAMVAFVGALLWRLV
jgi:hypothetical protein